MYHRQQVAGTDPFTFGQVFVAFYAKAGAEQSNLADCVFQVNLFVKLDKLQGQAKTAASLAQLPTRQATGRLEYLVATLADDKKMVDALKVFDLALATARRQNLSVPPSSTSRSSQGGGLTIA